MRIVTVDDIVSPDELLDRLQRRYQGLVQTTTWGERALHYSPEGVSARGIDFVTLKERDSDDDAVSALDVRGAYRLSFAVGPTRYHELFGPTPAAGCVYAGALDPLAVDTLMPHPIYAWMTWMSVVNPTHATLAALWPLLDESYALAQQEHAGRAGRAAGRAAARAAHPVSRGA